MATPSDRFEVAPETASSNNSSDSGMARDFTVASVFKQLPRTPLVPEAVLKRHGAYCALDSRFRAAARLKQALWLKAQGIPTAADDRCTTDTRSFLGSILSAEAARAGKNFLSADIHRLALHEYLMCEEDALIAPDRLFGHALSSAPLVFNLFGLLALDLKLATAVFRSLLPGIVHKVERIMFEHSPGRRSHLPGRDIWLSDRTAADLAVQITTLDGQPATIFIEVKLSESMGPAARMRDRYSEVSRQVLLYRDADSAVLRSDAIEQLWRLHLLSQLAVDNGNTPRAVFLAVAPQLNTQVWGAFRVYQGELIEPNQQGADRVPFVPLTLETVIEAIAAAGALDFAQSLWRRYCDFERVYQLCLQELIADDPIASTAQSRRGRSASQSNATPTSSETSLCPPTSRKRGQKAGS